jgi:hypothetical protein
MKEDSGASSSENSGFDQQAKRVENETPLPSVDAGKIETKEPDDSPHLNMEHRKRKRLSSFECWTIALWLVSIVVAAGTGGAIIYQDKLARDANRTANRAMEAQTRPWIGIEGDLRLETQEAHEGGMNIKFSMKLRNFGQSPAVRVVPIFKLLAGTAPFRIVERSKTCDEAQKQSAWNGGIHAFDSIFPGPEGTPKEINAPSDLLDFNGAPVGFTWLVGCIAYQLSGGNQIYETRVYYQIVSGHNPATSNGVKYMPITGFTIWDTEAQ